MLAHFLISPANQFDSLPEKLRSNDPLPVLKGMGKKGTLASKVNQEKYRIAVLKKKELLMIGGWT